MGSVTEVTEDSFEAEVILESGRIVVDFYTQTCPPCRAMAPVFEALAGDHEGRTKFVKIDAAASPGVAARYGIRAVPTFILFQAGEVLRQRAGACAKSEFESWLDET